MSRFGRDRQVFIFEEYIPTDHHLAYLEYHPFDGTDIVSIRPRIPHWWDEAQREAGLTHLLRTMLRLNEIMRPVLWFYSPMMFGFARDVEASAVVYDCMDELANFRFAPPRLRDLEAQLLERADVVFTGGQSLYAAKRQLHDNIHSLPSSVDVAHFASARGGMPPSSDLATPSGPKIGFYGVIDERIDLSLLDDVAAQRPEWSLVLVGPVAKLRPEELPQRPNLHFIGQRSYGELPGYLSGWDVAMMPFAINDATRFISPTKTPEYLAAGKPVVSTPVVDVVASYGDLPGVFIAATAAEFILACENALALKAQDWLPAVDEKLAGMSWDQTFARMSDLLDKVITNNSQPILRPPAVHTGRRADAYDVVIVGAGFAGSVLAERLASDGGKRVLLCDRRPHIGGNAYDHHDAAGILVHKYGPHIFHTNSGDIVDYLSRFTDWRPYEHRVLAAVEDKRVPMPINRTTLNLLYGLDLKDSSAAEEFLRSRAEPIAELRTSRDVVINQIGSELYRIFFEGYTRKQWGLDPSQLDKAVTARVPTRLCTDDRYFLDSFQAMPLNGYTAMFENMLDHDRIDLELGVDFADIRGENLAPRIIYTGPIDEYFGHRFGALPYRSLAFKHETLDQRRFQPVAVVNFPDEGVPYTRITEYKHLTGQVHRQTSISYEFPQEQGDPYYPIPRPENAVLYKRYAALADEHPGVSFVGRLGTYRYYNMDQVVGQALAHYRRMTQPASARAEVLS
ncbi:UDP-galactopyranose mutase [Devosia sp. MC521]|uniref:UDP-galactopyranose mutase n=1 Tax=Devosia sp. MC521 TaxID=2759954 RepID=UPI0015F87098|nr:UDP-galactopyranose mutase [Devosia sp. MC521]MBJ6986078.1 UDP-galactopyranose mutase [Devosia sp. MC521]QMW64546.1 UDP-galactopyranose mutase [Devosia sp. MC521]